LPLERPRGLAGRPASLELLMRGDSLELRCSRPPAPTAKEPPDAWLETDSVLLRVPLDPARLAEFRSHDPVPDVQTAGTNGGSWLASYCGQDENLGFEWQLSARDLGKKSEWENWKVLDSAPAGSEVEIQSVDISADAGGQEVPSRR
jgi:hypothetical protein